MIYTNIITDVILLDSGCIDQTTDCPHNPTCFSSSATGETELTVEQRAAEMKGAQLAEDIEDTAYNAEADLKRAIQEGNVRNIEHNRSVLRECLNVYTSMGLEADELPDPKANPK